MAEHFNWESGLTKTVRQAFHEKTAYTYTKQIYEWKQLWLKGKTPKYINPTVWLELQEHWVDQETIDKSIKNSANRNNDRGGKGIYVHNLGACSMSSKEDELVSSIYIYFKLYYIYVLINIVFKLKQMRVIPLIISMS